MSTPFRWRLERPEFLGSLLVGERAPSYPGFLHDLRCCCARILAQSQDATMVFVGRSPESIHDYLSGMLHGSSWEQRLMRFNISARESLQELRTKKPRALLAAKQHADCLGLAPAQIACAPRPVVLVDLVASGETLGNLVFLLRLWAREDHVDENALLRRLRILGITWSNRPSPHTFRWFQHAPWAKRFRPSQIRNLSISSQLWEFLGDDQQKTTLSIRPNLWGASEIEQPSRKPQNLQALRFAWDIYTKARTRNEREIFLRELAKQPSLKHAWYRSLLLELRLQGHKLPDLL